ncbi:hypothetical protein [Actinomadura sp. 21ATH]|uniref:hypothetical protein n=1 Tax=Actinomadura sp. 21ATH TaxID=1735444 RepID=UPI0035C0C7BF
MLISVVSATGLMACALTLAAAGCAIFAFAYLLQGTWLDAAVLLGGYGFAATLLILLGGSAKRRTARRRARAAAALAARCGR